MAKKKKGEKKQVRALKRSELESAKGGVAHGTDLLGQVEQTGLQARHLRTNDEVHVLGVTAPRIKH